MSKSVVYQGKKYASIYALAAEQQIPAQTVYGCLYRGRDLEQALQPAKPKSHMVSYAGKTYPSIKALAEDQQVSYSMLHPRLRKGFTVEEALQDIRHRAQKNAFKYEGKT